MQMKAATIAKKETEMKAIHGAIQQRPTRLLSISMSTDKSHRFEVHFIDFLMSPKTVYVIRVFME